MGQQSNLTVVCILGVLYSLDNLSPQDLTHILRYFELLLDRLFWFNFLSELQLHSLSCLQYCSLVPVEGLLRHSAESFEGSQNVLLRHFPINSLEKL
jgi:hypothetical protein